MASRPSTSVQPEDFKGCSSVSLSSAVNFVDFGEDCGELWRLVGYIFNNVHEKIMHFWLAETSAFSCNMSAKL